MKKRYAISLAVVLLVAASLLAMSTAAAPAEGFRVGWSEISIVPRTAKGDLYNYTNLGLTGYGDTDQRRVRTVDKYDVWANCIAATDEYNNTVLFVSMDIINSHYYLVEHARDAISAATGVPEKNIMFSASHTHSSIYIPEAKDLETAVAAINEDTTLTDAEKEADILQATIDYWYRDTFLVDRFVTLCQDAMADRKVVTKMSIGEVNVAEVSTDGEMNFVRHYWGVDPKTGDFVAVGDNHDDRSGIDYKSTVALTSTAKVHDSTMQLVRFDIEGRKLPVVMLKWIAHPCLAGSVNRNYEDMYYMFSGDYISPLRYAMYQNGFDMSFFQGAAGNVNAYERGTSKYKNEYDTSGNLTYNGVDAYGNELARIAKEALNSSIMQEISTGLIQVDVDKYDAERFDHSDNMDAELYSVATAVQEEWRRLQKLIGTPNASGVTYTNALTRWEARDITANADRVVHSVYHAGSIRSSYNSKEAGTFNEKQNMTTNAISIGTQWSMVTGPGEVFDVLYLELQKTMAKEYPDKTVFTVAYSNSKLGYIPARYAYDAEHGGSTEGYMDYLTKDQVFCTYETDTTPLAAGSGEAMVQRQLMMLRNQDAFVKAMQADPESYYCECAGTLPENHTCTTLEWKAWPETTSLPTTTGNYYLTENVELTAQQYLEPSAVVRLDLRGKTVTQKGTSAHSIYVDYTGTTDTTRRTLVITDSSDQRDGKLVSKSGTVRQGGVIRAINSGVRMYAGTLDASKAIVMHRHGGAAVYVGYGFTMYGGTILGGTSMGENEATSYPGDLSEGGAVAVRYGTMRMYGGVITGGISDLGGGIFVEEGAQLHLYGDATVTGNFGNEAKTDINNIYVKNATSLTVHEGYTGQCGVTIAGGSAASAAFAVSDGYNLSGSIIADDHQTFAAGLSGTNLVWVAQDAAVKSYDTAGNLLGEYLTLSAAIDVLPPDGSRYVKLAKDVTENVTLTHDAYIDLAGHDISGNVTIDDGATLYCMDSTTDDYDCSDGYGKITGTVSGKQADCLTITKGSTKYIYLLVTKATATSYEHSYHRVHMRVKTMNLKADENGLYYGCEFAGDSVVKNSMHSFGVAFSLTEVPTKATMTNPLTYTAYSKSSFVAGLNANGTIPNDGNGTLIYGVVKPELPNYLNKQNAAKAIYGVAYIKTTQGTMAFGSPVSYSLQWLVETIDSQWDAKIANGTLPQSEIDNIVAMYNTYKQFMQTWNIPNIKAAAAK